MNRIIGLCVLASFLALTSASAGSAPVSQTRPAAQTSLSAAQLESIQGGSFWACAFTFAAASALVVGVGVLTAGTGAIFVGAVVGAGGLGLTAELHTCVS